MYAHTLESSLIPTSAVFISARVDILLLCRRQRSNEPFSLLSPPTVITKLAHVKKPNRRSCYVPGPVQLAWNPRGQIWWFDEISTIAEEKRRPGRRFVRPLSVERIVPGQKDNHLSQGYESRSFYSAVLLVNHGEAVVPVDGFVK